MEGYTLHGVLGTGAHAEVHRAEPATHPGRIVAVKRFLAPPTRDSVAEVRREAAILERLSHPSIVRLLDVAPDGDGVALVTPFLPGGTLADRVARSSLPTAAVADLGARLGDALAAAHAAGVVHGDVKPSNVLYDAEEQPLLADFGAAVLLGETPAATIGTAAYLDPEVAAGRAQQRPASDQYALGVLLYEALAGSPPYAAPTVEATLRAADRGVHVPLADLVPDAPVAVTDAIERALARDPAARFATVRELASRLEEARAGLDTWTSTVTPPRDGTFPSTDAVTPPPPETPAPGGRRRDGASLPPAGGRATPDRPLPTGRTVSTGGDDPTLTRRFGPAPPAPADPPAPDRRRVPMLLAAFVVLLVPIAIVVAFLVAGDDPDELPTPPASTEQARRLPVELPRCEDAPALPEDSGVAVAADTEGRGCVVELGWDAERQILTVPRTDGPPTRYQLGEPGDLLVVGDWNCDGRQSPGLYRPATGEAFTFDGFAGEGGELESGPAQATGTPDGEPFVATGEDGCDRIEVRTDA